MSRFFMVHCVVIFKSIYTSGDFFSAHSVHYRLFCCMSTLELDNKLLCCYCCLSLMLLHYICCSLCVVELFSFKQENYSTKYVQSSASHCR